MIKNSFKYSDVTNKIIRAFYNVYNELGYGFLEKVYERAMMIELAKFGLKAENQKPIEVYYNKIRVGEYFADIVVENVVICELKAAESICPEHEAQLLNYLKDTNIEVGLLLNFGPEAKFKRKAYSNDYKKS